MKVWDLPTRLFHWSLALLLIALFATAYTGHMEAHAVAGQAMLVLLLFRLVWGWIGSQSAKFQEFVKGPSAIRAYLSGAAQPAIGHNPVGALMIVFLLASLLAQAAAGMFSSDSLGFNGPYAHLISHTSSAAAARFHILLAYLIATMAALHVAAVLMHWLRHGENLIPPMFSGEKWVPRATPELRFVSSVVALAVFAASIVVFVVVRRIT